jgi:hypothetical protein
VFSNPFFDILLRTIEYTTGIEAAALLMAGSLKIFEHFNQKNYVLIDREPSTWARWQSLSTPAQKVGQSESTTMPTRTTKLFKR